MKTTILGLVLLALAVGPAVAAELSMDDDFPVVGKGQKVTLSGADQTADLTLWVVYSPNSETQTEEEVGIETTVE